MEVYDGDSTHARRLGRYCGDQLPRSLITSGSNVFVVFHTDSSERRGGFAFNYTNANGKIIFFTTGIHIVCRLHGGTSSRGRNVSVCHFPDIKNKYNDLDVYSYITDVGSIRANNLDFLTFISQPKLFKI